MEYVARFLALKIPEDFRNSIFEKKFINQKLVNKPGLNFKG